MDPITIGMALMKFAPTIAGWLFKKDDSDSEAKNVTDKVLKVVQIAQNLTGETDENKAIKALEKNKDLAGSFQHAVASLELEILKEENKRIESVNETMRTEAKSEHWPQYSWRPFNGFLFGITVFFIYVVFPIFEVTAVKIPSEVFMMWGAVLGVTAWHRGAQKREEKTGGKNPGFSNIIDRTLGR